MQSDKDMIEMIKEAFPLNPSQKFVVSTERMLRQRARKIEKKRNVKRISIASSGLVLFAVAMAWIFFFSGNEVILNKLDSFGEGRNSSYVEKEAIVYINHSHNWESFIPEIDVEDPNEAFHETKNITLVGERLTQALKERNIYAIHDKTNVEEVLKERGLTFTDSYNVTRESLIDTLENEKSIQMVFDIHRDSHRRNATTINIDGVDYARIVIVISRSSGNYEKNKDFAKLIHQKLEEKYPGLSRGVVEQDGKSQSTYNQDLIDNSLLLEIGGVDNSLEEAYRTVDAFAEVIQEVSQ